MTGKDKQVLTRDEPNIGQKHDAIVSLLSSRPGLYPNVSHASRRYEAIQAADYMTISQDD